MKNEIDIIRDLANKFAEGGIDYMLTGSLAMNYYAQPCMTRDIDVVVWLEPQDVDVIVRLFSSELLRGARGRQRCHRARVHFQFDSSGERHQGGLHRAEGQRLPAAGIYTTQRRHDSEFHDLDCEQRRFDHLQTPLGARFQIGVATPRCEKSLATGYDAGYLEKWTQALGVYELLRECFDG